MAFTQCSLRHDSSHCRNEHWDDAPVEQPVQKQRWGGRDGQKSPSSKDQPLDQLQLRAVNGQPLV